MRLPILFVLILVHLEVDASTWRPRPRTVGWGPDAHAPVLRIRDGDRATPARNRPEWIRWRATVGVNRSYLNATHEELHARIFEESELMVSENNIAFERGEASYQLALNKFADLAEEELGHQGMGVGNDMESPANITEHTDSTQNKAADGCEVKSTGAPAVFDWSTRIKMVQPKNQGKCGSCYAFAGVGAVEAQIAIHKNELYYLSEQYAMDCTRKFSEPWNNGCGGGYASVVFDWLLSNNRGLLRGSGYQYTGNNQGDCPSASGDELYKIKCFRGFFSNDEELLRKLIYEFGPIPSGLYSKNEDFALYKKGIYDNLNCKGRPDHEILTVGYGMELSKKYWIIRNSWGAEWGMDGYFHLERGRNICGFPYRLSWVQIQ